MRLFLTTPRRSTRFPCAPIAPCFFARVSRSLGALSVSRGLLGARKSRASRVAEGASRPRRARDVDVARGRELGGGGDLLRDGNAGGGAWGNGREHPHEFEVRRRPAAGTRREARRGERRALFGAPSMPSRRRGNARGLRERAAGTFPACIEPPEPRANALSSPATPRRRRTLEMWLALRNRRVKLHLHSGCAHPARLVPGERSPRRVHLRVRPPPPPERTEPSRHGKKKKRTASNDHV